MTAIICVQCNCKVGFKAMLSWWAEVQGPFFSASTTPESALQQGSSVSCYKLVSMAEENDRTFCCTVFWHPLGIFMKGKEDRNIGPLGRGGIGIQFGTCAGPSPMFALELLRVDVSAVHKCPATGGTGSWSCLKSGPSTAQRRCSTTRKSPLPVS